MLCLKTSQSNAYSLDTRLDCIIKTSLTMSVSLLITPQRYYFFFTCKLHLIFFFKQNGTDLHFRIKYNSKCDLTILSPL